MKVRNSVFYHINQKAKWSVFNLLNIGDEIFIGNESNPFFKYFEEHQLTIPVTLESGKVIESPGIRFLRGVRDKEVNCIELPQIAYDISVHFVKYVRELLWEDIRKAEFQNLPSRQRCIWLISSEDGIKYWQNRLKCLNDFQVVKVKVEGNLHKANELLLLGDCEPMKVTIEKARQYWAGENADDGKEEILFEGKLEVLEIVSNSSESKV